MQLKAIGFAEANRLRFSITGIGSGKATEIGPFNDRLDEPGTQSRPLRVALLGCGTVGGGVYERLAALPHLFTVIGVGTRSAARALLAGVPPQLITNNLDALIENKCDVVVELIGQGHRSLPQPDRRARRRAGIGQHVPQLHHRPVHCPVHIVERNLTADVAAAGLHMRFVSMVQAVDQNLPQPGEQLPLATAAEFCKIAIGPEHRLLHEIKARDCCATGVPPISTA